MILEEMLKEAREEGYKEGWKEGFKEGFKEGLAEGRRLSIIVLLRRCEPVPEALQDRILDEKNLLTLKKWLKLAASVNSLEEFQKNM